MTTKKMDGAQLAIFSNRFEGVSRKMGNTLLRTGRSGVLNRARDFSCCIVTRDCELLATAESLPIHVLSGPDLMAKSMHGFFPELKKGDAFLHNSPYHGCSHAADHTLIVPVIDDEGEHHFTVLVKAHQADIGNSVPTTYHGTAQDVYDEGALIFPCVQAQRDYKNIEDIVRMCEMRIRVPEQWRGDYLALVGAARIGEREILAMGKEIGWDSLHQFTDQWFDYSERRMQQAIKELPAGVATRSAIHDAIDGSDAGIEIKATVKVDSENGRIEVDVRDNPDCMPNGLNLSESTSRTAILVGIFNSIDHSVPKNAGSFRCVDTLLREGCIAGIPKHPFSCSVATTNIADRLACSVQMAFAELGDGSDQSFGMAELGPSTAPSDAVISGIDPETNKPFVNQLFLGHTCGAGSGHSDGWLTSCHVGNAGMSFLDSIELTELYHPILIKQRSLIQDSEGAGRHRGAPGLCTEYAPMGFVLEAGYVSDGTINTAQGVKGGGRGSAARQYRRSPDGELITLPAFSMETIKDGESIVSYCCGGGGYGNPKDRDPELVRKDVGEGYISEKRAAEVYGVDI
ncbi:MAG: hydantoinase B/oxoprolinase family protein [Gammaproteobacteria bacterium]|nr:MAG: hydantoinase B/oxoprolinase family protein [Gammaproteobacteria bacterium]